MWLAHSMKKRIVYIIVISLLLGGAAAGYWYFFRPAESSATDLLQLVPDHAVVVYGSDNLKQDWESFQAHPGGELLATMPFFQEVNEGYDILDSIGDGISFSSAWLKQRTLISLHLTGRSGFDFIFYANLGGKAQSKSLEVLHDHFVDRSDVRYKEREYEGVTIHQFQARESETTFYYSQVGDFFIGSFTGYLLEDVIRHLGDGGTSHFFAQHPTIKAPDESSLEGRWWVNLKRWPELMNVFLPANQEAKWQAWGDFIELDAVLGEEVMLWSGFTPQGVYREPKEVLDVFQSQDNGRFRLLGALPARTAFAFHWQLNDPVAYQQAMYQYQLQTAPDFNAEREAFANRFLLDYEDFLDAAGPEVAMVVLESVSAENPDKLFIARTPNASKAEVWLRNLSTKVAATSLDSLYLESYLGEDIRLADVYNLPGYLFGQVFSGFDQTFYATIGDYLLLGNTAQGIRRVLEDWSSGQVLNKSVQSAVFLENTLEEGVCGWFLQSPRAWSHVLPLLNAEWQSYFEADGLAWRGIAGGAIQFRKDANRWFTAMVVQPKVDLVAPEDRRFTPMMTVPLVQNAASPPYVVRNHNNGVREVVIQDEDGFLYLLDPEGNILWRDSVGEPLVSDVQQIDFYGNGKLQFFFATASGIHILDRNGLPVPGFPVALPPGEQVNYASVIDYDGTKRYRFAVGTIGGGVFLFDKSGFPLEGWNPKIFSSPLAQPPFHVRVRGLDRIVVPLADGKVAITNRRGEMQDGFPVDIRGQVTSQLFVQEGTDLDNTLFRAVTNEGELVTFTMAGKVTERKQLYKPTRDAKFSLVPDVLGQTFLIGRMSEGQIGFLDAEGQELFQKEFLTSGNVLAQFYRFGAGREVILVTDQEQEFSYVFDYQGNLVNYRPINNAFKAGVLYYESTNAFHVYTVFGNQVSVSTYQP